MRYVRPSDSFNGAARRCARKGKSADVEGGRTSSFNGAARRCARKVGRLKGCGVGSGSFNGAARRCARKALFESRCRLDGLASMGPRADARGRYLNVRERLAFRLLQWGRAQMRAEGSHARCRARSSARLQWGRAQMRAEGLASELRPAVAEIASMGPRADARGREKYTSSGRCSDCQLQWGRAQMRAEGTRTATPAVHRQQSFNGAARRCARKGRRARMSRGNTCAASMGPRADARGRCPRIPRLPRRPRSLQWGRAQMRAEGAGGVF